MSAAAVERPIIFRDHGPNLSSGIRRFMCAATAPGTSKWGCAKDYPDNLSHFDLSPGNQPQTQ
jgi:hypothetical protein